MTKWNLLGQEIKKIREANTNLSQSDFAKNLHLSKSLISRVEAGERRLSKETIIELAEKLNVDEYNKIKLLIYSNYTPELKKTKQYRVILIDLVTELKSKALYEQAKKLIYSGLEILNKSPEFYSLLSTVYLVEKNYDIAEKYIKKAIELFFESNEAPLISEAELYHNMGNVYFSRSYHISSERQKILIEKLKEPITKEQLFQQKDFLEINDQVINFIEKAEKYFLLAYNSDSNHEHIIGQLGRIYTSLSNLNLHNKSFLSHAQYFLSRYLSFEISLSDRVEITSFLAMVYAGQEKYDQAKVLINTIIEFQKDNALLYYSKAVIYSLSFMSDIRDLEVSYKSLEKAINLSNYGIRYDIKEESKSEIDLEKLRFNSLYKDKFYNLIYT